MVGLSDDQKAKIEKGIRRVKVATGLLGVAATGYFGRMGFDGKAQQIDGEAKLNQIEILQPAAESDKATKTLAALEQEKIKATSEIIQSIPETKWGLLGALAASGVALGSVINPIPKKLKPALQNDEKNDQKDRS